MRSLEYDRLKGGQEGGTVTCVQEGHSTLGPSGVIVLVRQMRKLRLMWEK